MNQASAKVAALADRVVGAIPQCDAIGQRIAVTLYRLLSEGQPVPLERVADAVGLSEALVEANILTCTVFRDEGGAIVGFGGLTVAEMPPHRFTVDGRTLYTWCAWDSLFIPGILGKTAIVESVCPMTKAPISLEVGPEGIRQVTPPTVVVSFLTPDRPFDRNVILNFCHFVHFFRDAEAAEAWLSRHAGTFLLSLNEAFALGEVTNARNFGLALRSVVHR